MNDEELQKKAEDFVANLVSSLSNSKDELNIQFKEVIRWVYLYSQAEPSSVIEGEIQLDLESNPGNLCSQVTKDGEVVYTRFPGTNRTDIRFEEYPNLATEAPIKWLLILLKSKLHWEMVTFNNHKGLNLRIVPNESQYKLVPKNFIAVQGTETGLLAWGNGNGEVSQTPLWPSYQLPDFS